MTPTPLSTLEIAGLVALCVLLTIGLVMLGRWINRELREWHETKRATGVAISEEFERLRRGDQEALERFQRSTRNEIGH